MKITFYGTRDYDHLYFDVLAADPEYGCDIRFLAANLDKDTAPLAAGGEAVCAFVNADGSAPVLETLAAVGVKLLLLRCAGFNNVDLDAAKRCGITVLRVPGYSPEAVAEHAMALAMAANRRICKAYIKVRNNNFALDGLLGHTLYGSAAGIVGTGRIGAAMARICCGFGMTVLAYDQYRNPALEGLVRYVGLEELLRTADLVSLHCPLTPETHHMIDADAIKMMRDSAILVNTSRGGLIDTHALIDALRQRKFAGVGLDVRARQEFPFMATQNRRSGDSVAPIRPMPHAAASCDHVGMARVATALDPGGRTTRCVVPIGREHLAGFHEALLMARLTLPGRL